MIETDAVAETVSSCRTTRSRETVNACEIAAVVSNNTFLHRSTFGISQKPFRKGNKMNTEE
jgi:hypothetical protein